MEPDTIKVTFYIAESLGARGCNIFEDAIFDQPDLEARKEALGLTASFARR